VWLPARLRAHASGLQQQLANCTPLQRLDATCAAVAQAGLVVQLAAVLWRLLGQLLALEGLVFVLLKPVWLARLHLRLVNAVVWISGALQRAGAGRRVMDAGACSATRPCLDRQRCSGPCPEQSDSQQAVINVIKNEAGHG
jgi:hypothetical protein